jgi:hypothetical protein
MSIPLKWVSFISFLVFWNSLHVFYLLYYVKKYEANLRLCMKTVSKRFCLLKSSYTFVHKAKIYDHHNGPCKPPYLSEYRQMHPNSLTWYEYFNFLSRNTIYFDNLMCYKYKGRCAIDERVKNDLKHCTTARKKKAKQWVKPRIMILSFCDRLNAALNGKM